jgi:predicted dehydrogenase
MSIASALGSGHKVRYGFVGLGDIAQEAMLPAVAHTGNSAIAALVTGDPVKARELGARYGVTDTYGYEQFETMLRSDKVDAIYLATPNWEHERFILPALEAGIHVLVEKPLEISAARCRAIVEAQRRSTAKLMVAYRLHFEPATLDAIRRIRAGELGELILFSCALGQPLDPANHRAKHGWKAGPLFDMGPYPVNASRYLFGAEPVEVVSAIATRHAAAGLGDLDDTIAVILRFPDDALAQFTVSFATDNMDTYVVAGTKGVIQLTPGTGFGETVERTVSHRGKKKHESVSATDQFGGELRYFSNCVLKDMDPEPDAEEALADIVVLEAIMRSLDSGASESIEPVPRARRIDPDAQEQTLSFKSPPEPVHAALPSRQDD